MSRRGTGRVGTSRKWLHSRRQRTDTSLVSASASMRRTRGSKRRLALPNGIDTVIGDAQDMRDRSEDGRTGLLWGLIPVLRALRTRSSHGTLSNQVACSRRLATEDRMGRAPGMRGKLRRALRGARKRFKAREGCKALVEIFVCAYGNAPHDGRRFRAHKVQEARYAQRPVG